jgi:DNA-binding transcriptional ArsR family regulator
MLSRNKLLLFKKQAEILQAIGHPIRIAIANFLKDGEKCVCEIAEFVGSERSNVSKHLSVMVGAGLLDSHKEGLNVIYRLKCPCVLDFLACTMKCLKHQLRENDKLIKVL